jgi:hypothetical protein
MFHEESVDSGATDYSGKSCSGRGKLDHTQVGSASALARHQKGFSTSFGVLDRRGGHLQNVLREAGLAELTLTVVRHDIARKPCIAERWELQPNPAGPEKWPRNPGPK